MKKIISLLLVLVLALTALSGMALAAASECDEADAVVKVSDESGDVYYLDDLDSTVVYWACKSLTEGRRTVTLLKDIVLDPAGAAMASAYFHLPGSTGSWGNKGMGKFTFDLNGHTMSYKGEANLFYHMRWAFEVKNGTIIYENTRTDYSRFVVASGESNGSTANFGESTTLVPWEPHVVFENVDVYNVSKSPNPAIFRSNIYNVVFDVTDCNLYVENGWFTIFGMTSQANASDKYTGAYAPKMVVKNSTLVSENEAFRTATDIPAGASVELTDSVIAVKGSVLMAGDEEKITVTSGAKEVANYDVKLSDGTTVTATGYLYGNVPGADAPEAPLPFTDVKEADWFYSFVKELYTKGVVAGTSATTFAPNANLTYAAALKLLVVGLTGKDAGNATTGHWASNYLNEAVAAGWTAIDASMLNNPITREAFCEIAAKAKNLTEQPETNNFTDTTNTSVLALVKAGVINGMNETTFAPAGILTRAQITKIISLLLKL